MAFSNSTSTIDSNSVLGYCDICNRSTESPLYRFSLDFMFYSLSLIVPIGLVCNTISVVVFTTPQMRRRASSWYLAALAVSDNLSLVAIMFDYWLKSDKVGLQVMRTSRAMCTGITHLSYSSRLLSAWLVTTFTFERFVAVVYPLRRSSVISIAHARNVIILETVACVVLSSFTLFTIGLVPDHKGEMVSTDCDVLPQMARAYAICNVIFLIFGSIVVPVLTIVVLNFLILKRIGGRSDCFVPNLVWSPRHLDLHNRQNQLESRPKFQDQRYHLNRSKSNSQPDPNASVDVWSAGAQPSRSFHSRTLRDYSVTTVLLAVSTTFVILNVPYCVSWFVSFFSYYSLGDDEEYPHPEIALTLFATKYLTSVPYFLNYGLNFVLYSLCARTFRAQLCRTLHRVGCYGCLRKTRVHRGRKNEHELYPGDILNVNTFLRHHARRQTESSRKTASAPSRIVVLGNEAHFSGHRPSEDRPKTA